MPRPRAADWTGGAYVRVFRTLPLDRPDVWEDDRALAWWVRLLVGADAAWPLTPALPRDLPADLEDALVQAEVIDRIGASAYRFHGLDRLRGSGQTLASKGGKARALGPRGEDGRYLPTAGTSRVDEPGGHTNGGTPLPAGSTARVGEASPADVPQPGSSSQETRREETTTDPPNVGSSSSSSSSTPRGWVAPKDCDDPDGHRAAHRRVPGLDVWRCPTCEAAHRAKDDEPSFADRVGWAPPAEEVDDGRPF